VTNLADDPGGNAYDEKTAPAPARDAHRSASSALRATPSCLSRSAPKRIGEAETGEAPEDNPAPLQISGRTKLLLGLSLAVTGTGLTIVGELYRTPFQEARAAYKSIDPATASVAEIEAARKEFANKRLLHYIPLFSGLSMSGIGLFLTFDGAFSISIYEPSPYSPTPVIPEEQSGFVISPNFSGFVLRY
jgi:hypothetical protein